MGVHDKAFMPATRLCCGWKKNFIDKGDKAEHRSCSRVTKALSSCLYSCFCLAQAVLIVVSSILCRINTEGCRSAMNLRGNQWSFTGFCLRLHEAWLEWTWGTAKEGRRWSGYEILEEEDWCFLRTQARLFTGQYSSVKGCPYNSNIRWSSPRVFGTNK